MAMMADNTNTPPDPLPPSWIPLTIQPAHPQTSHPGDIYYKYCEVLPGPPRNNDKSPGPNRAGSLLHTSGQRQISLIKSQMLIL